MIQVLIQHFLDLLNYNTNIYINSGQNTYVIYKSAAARGSDTVNPARSDASSTFIYNATDILTTSYRSDDGTTDQSDIILTNLESPSGPQRSIIFISPFFQKNNPIFLIGSTKIKL